MAPSCTSSLDTFLSYSTSKVVQIRDRRLGLLYLGILSLVVTYIVVYVFYVKQGYLEKQFTTGLVATKIKGTSVIPGDVPLYFDEADAVYPPIEAGGIFIISRYQLTEGQHLDWCEPDTDLHTNCSKDADCPPTHGTNGSIPAKCGPMGICMSFQWCPAEDPLVNTTQTFHIVGAEKFTIWFKASIQFTELGTPSQTFFSTITQSTPIWPPDPKANLFSVRDLVGKLPPDQVGDWATMLTWGAILKVTVEWDVNINTQRAQISYSSTRLDNAALGNGFNFRTCDHYKDTNGIARRDLYKYFGFRIFLQSTGTGYKISIPSIVLNISSGIALLGIATVIVDLLAINALPQAKTYRKFKVQTTEVLYKRLRRTPPTTPNTGSQSSEDPSDDEPTPAHQGGSYVNT
eukprot:TRINITY_DN96665_c0_g1_i1.p1 TRINITY_DN96665_c0_g1~~TRINITY_DN96665_c0_g1_i1.p1  ORF type:complete len:403 (-),score=51.58 TRINITY_DN96665_c0_g1_i1:30-1238(-)